MVLSLSIINSITQLPFHYGAIFIYLSDANVKKPNVRMKITNDVIMPQITSHSTIEAISYFFHNSFPAVLNIFRIMGDDLNIGI